MHFDMEYGKPMNELISPYQFAIVTALCVWLFPLVSAWVRYDILPHSVFAFISIFIAPLILLDDILIAFDLLDKVPYLLNIFWFAPVLVTILCFLSVRKIIMETPGNVLPHLLVVGVFIAGEIPFLLLPGDLKISLRVDPFIGGILDNWMFYLYHLLSAIVIAVYAVLSVNGLKQYSQHLSEHVVDISFYRTASMTVTLATLSAVAATAIITILVVAFDLLPITKWLTGLAVLYSLILCLVMMSLLEKRRLAPSPFDYEELANKKYPHEYMQAVLNKAERAIIKHKAYRKKGIAFAPIEQRCGY